MAYKGVLDDIRTCLNGGIPRQLPVFGMSQIIDANSAGHTYEVSQHVCDHGTGHPGGQHPRHGLGGKSALR